MRSLREVDEIFSPDELQKKISKVPRWFHIISLGTQLSTPGNYAKFLDDWISNSLLSDYSGKSVLDVGTADGRWAFECERRNAKKITGIDIWQTSDDFGSLPFETCKEILDSKATLQVLDVVDVEQLNENFDVIHFLGVYYHMLNPLLALQKIFNVCNELVIMEGAMLQTERSLAYALKKGELNADITNVFLFSPSFIERFALSIGFKKVEFKGYSTKQGTDILSDAKVTNSEKILQHNRGILYLWK